jgi:peptidyl-prolyl cis-trans isomerase C
MYYANASRGFAIPRIEAMIRVLGARAYTVRKPGPATDARSVFLEFVLFNRSRAMPRAVASHILVKTEAEALDLKNKIETEGADFAELAKQHSSCPSGRKGGSLGEFAKGAMVPEFDKVVFSDLPINAVSAPVKTQFGYHLLKVEKRLG